MIFLCIAERREIPGCGRSDNASFKQVVYAQVCKIRPDNGCVAARFGVIVQDPLTAVRHVMYEHRCDEQSLLKRSYIFYRILCLLFYDRKSCPVGHLPVITGFGRIFRTGLDKRVRHSFFYIPVIFFVIVRKMLMLLENIFKKPVV